MRNPDQSKLMELIRDYATLMWQEGIQIGHMAAATNLIDESGRKFSIGMDEQAEMLRKMGREIQKEVRDREQAEKPKRDKRKEELYKEILGQLENMVEVDAEADNSLEVSELIAEVRRRRNG